MMRAVGTADFAWTQQGNLTEGELSTVGLLGLTSLNQLVFKVQTLFTLLQNKLPQ
jgi:hypothetical protein